MKEQKYSELSDFLIKKRSSIKPEDVGLKDTGRRRTPGLRREEVADLAGVGLTWYTWLEQGRPISVSEAVVENIAKVLQMNADEKKYFYRLTGTVLTGQIRDMDEETKLHMGNVIKNLRYCPSLLINQYWDVILWNQEAQYLFDLSDDSYDQSRNIVYEMFLNPRYCEIFLDWENYAKNLVAAFRMSYGEHIQDPRFEQIRNDISEKSEEFRKWWKLHKLDNSSAKIKEMRLASTGVLKFEVTNFVPMGYDNYRFVIHTPVGDTMEKMKSLFKSE